MCGINGWLSGAGSVRQDEVRRVRDAMAKRGPDAAGEWFSPDGRVGLGHRRLSIIDLSDSGNQPLWSADGRYVIVFNGEIYNYRELRADLEAEGEHFRTATDTEVVLSLFARQGTGSFRRLRGMFAFAIYDTLTKQMTLARDLTGIKPLYYAATAEGVKFASQVKALLLSDGIDTAYEPAAHVAFFLYGRCPIEKTLYRGIKALPPGSFVVVDDGGVTEPESFGTIKQYFTSSGAPLTREELREILLDTMRAHFVADVPVSLFLSAGRDSATMLALASEIRQEPIHAVTLAFEEFRGTPDDEAVLAREAADLYGANHTIRMVNKQEFASDLDGILGAMDQPTVDGVNTYYVSKVTAELGVKVALSGVGADEIFGGYPSYRQVPRLALAMKPFGAIPGLGVLWRNLTTKLMPGSVSPKFAGLLEYGSTLEGAYMLRRALHLPWEVMNVLDTDFARQGLEDLGYWERLHKWTREIGTAHAKIALLELGNFMFPQLLVDSDWASMAHSLELRVPFVDKVVLNGVGPAVAGVQPPTKTDMALTPKVPLPESFMNRPKTGFSVPVRRWIAEMNDIDMPSHSLRDWSRFIYSQFVTDSQVMVNPKRGSGSSMGQAASL